MTVDPNLTIAIHAVKLNKDQLPVRARGNGKRFAIPAETTWQRSTLKARRILLAEFAFDTPVMRKIQLPPLRIVESDVLCVRGVAKSKAPILVERNSFVRARIGEAN
jgi:hypothetical protein